MYGSSSSGFCCEDYFQLDVLVVTLMAENISIMSLLTWTHHQELSQVSKLTDKRRKVSGLPTLHERSNDPYEILESQRQRKENFMMELLPPKKAYNFFLLVLSMLDWSQYAHQNTLLQR